MRLSIVVTTYNRKDLVLEAIDSMLPWLLGPVDTEIIVVDDASSDATVAHLERRYTQEIANQRIRLVPLKRNRGESGAKNAGTFAANGDWIVFVDSDDVLLPNSQSIVADAIAAHPEHVLLFFRCLTFEDNQLMGSPAAGSTEVSARDFTRSWRFSECMPVGRRDVLMAIPFDEDLRGFPDSAWGRIIRRYGPLLVWHKPTRRYRLSNDDRLTTKAMLRKRACLMARGHARMLRYMPGDYGVRAGCYTLAKVVYYALQCLLNKLHR
ncbi:MAG: glycosyltransferase family 2 protein [Candidatus Binatia bacterium]